MLVKVYRKTYMSVKVKCVYIEKNIHVMCLYESSKMCLYRKTYMLVKVKSVYIEKHTC